MKFHSANCFYKHFSINTELPKCVPAWQTENEIKIKMGLEHMRIRGFALYEEQKVKYFLYIRIHYMKI